MKPGRNLDALVAEKVMGVTVQKDQVTRGLLAEKCPNDPWEYFVGATNDRVPPYSTDIAAAWQVVDKLGDKLRFLIDTRGRMTEVSVSDVYDGSIYWEEGGLSAPHAICLAALKAVGAYDGG